MKHHILLTTVATALLAQGAFAGEYVAPPSKGYVAPAPLYYGVGFYAGFQAGVNVWQDFGDTREFNIRGNDVEINADTETGFVGGIKLGYVFGTGTVRPAIEADLYYNGLEANLHTQVNGDDVGFGGNADLHSGAFMANFLLRFAFDRFQPYVGAGIGGYYAEAQNVQVTIGDNTFDVDGGSQGGWAWQIIAGVDYYFTEKTSVFAEYKFLNYEDAGFSGDRIGQQIIVAGMKFHF